jgi:hypothetical protein
MQGPVVQSMFNANPTCIPAFAHIRLSQNFIKYKLYLDPNKISGNISPDHVCKQDAGNILRIFFINLRRVKLASF